MTKPFKAGDKVQVISDKEDFPKGTVLTVKSGPMGDIRGGNYTFEEGEGIVLGDDLKLINFQSQKFKVGDKVRILNAEAITACEAKDGDVLKVVCIDELDGTPILKDKDKDLLIMYPSELKYIELADEKLTKKKRIELLEAEVAALKAEVESLKRCCTTADKVAATVKEQTPNDQRKAIIAEARAFVEKYSGVVKYEETPYTTDAGDTTVKLFVNKDKRIVTAIPHLVHARHTVHSDKKFAKCAPTDVFNAEIGKAIALGRVLGLDVSKFENAPRPAEFVIGQLVKPKWTSVDSFREKPAKIVKFENGSFGTSGVIVDAHNPNRSDNMTWAGLPALTIVADTEAVYE